MATRKSTQKAVENKPVQEEPVLKGSSRNWSRIVLLVAAGIIIIYSLYLGIKSIVNPDNLPITRYNSIFVDMNGDGRLDYVKNAEVVLNQESNLANPASVYCEEQGGKLEIQTGEDGSQLGMCTLNNGIVCEEWAYYNGECGTPYPLPESP